MVSVVNIYSFIFSVKSNLLDYISKESRSACQVSKPATTMILKTDFFTLALEQSNFTKSTGANL